MTVIQKPSLGEDLFSLNIKDIARKKNTQVLIEQMECVKEKRSYLI